MKLIRVIEDVWRIYATCDTDGSCPLMVALQALDERGNDDSGERILALFQQVAARPDGPRGLGEEKSKLLDAENRILEFKIGQFRIPYFYESNHIILCTHLFMKKSRRTPRREIDRAIRTKRAYEEASRNKAIQWS